MMSLSVIVVPVLLDTNSDPNHILRQWARLYHYGHIYMPALCVTTCALYIFAALSKTTAAGQRQWSRYATAAVSTVVMIPFTWLVMTPTNNTLFRLGASGSVMDLNLVRGLVVKWSWLHVTRSLSPLLGAFLGFTGILEELCAQP